MKQFALHAEVFKAEVSPSLRRGEWIETMVQRHAARGQGVSPRFGGGSGLKPPVGFDVRCRARLPARIKSSAEVTEEYVTLKKKLGEA